MQSHNSRILNQTPYYARYSKRVIDAVCHDVSRSALGSRSIPALFLQPIMPCVVRVEGYLEIEEGKTYPISSDESFRLFLDPDPDDSPFFQRFAGFAYDAVRQRAFAESTKFTSVSSTDFQRLGETLSSALSSADLNGLLNLSAELAKLIDSVDVYHSFHSLP